MFGLGAPELIIILLILVVLFGASRLRGLGGALGGSIREFKSAVREDDPNAPVTPVTPVVPPVTPVTPATPVPPVDQPERRV